jgi:hypothetical protein
VGIREFAIPPTHLPILNIFFSLKRKDLIMAKSDRTGKSPKASTKRMGKKNRHVSKNTVTKSRLYRYVSKNTVKK